MKTVLTALLVDLVSGRVAAVAEAVSKLVAGRCLSDLRSKPRMAAVKQHWSTAPLSTRPRQPTSLTALRSGFDTSAPAYSQSREFVGKSVV